MDSVLVDQSKMSSRNVADSEGGFVMKSRHSSLNSYSSLRSLSQLLPNHHAAAGGFRSYGSHPLQPPPQQQLYASLPSSFCIDQAVVPPLPHVQPPLLPLPLTKPATLPPSPKITRTNTGNGVFRSRDHRSTKPKPSMNPRKEPQSSTKAACQSREPKEEPQRSTVEKATAFNNGVGKEEEEKEASMDSIYSLSPPPSNLPLPSFLLTRERAKAATCTAEVIMEGGGGAGGCGRR